MKENNEVGGLQAIPLNKVGFFVLTDHGICDALMESRALNPAVTCQSSFSFAMFCLLMCTCLLGVAGQHVKHSLW